MRGPIHLEKEIDETQVLAVQKGQRTCAWCKKEEMCYREGIIGYKPTCGVWLFCTPEKEQHIDGLPILYFECGDTE